MEKANSISDFVKYNRNKLKITQEQLAVKAGVGLRFIRDLEQGKETLQLDKVNQVLLLFGHHLTPTNRKLVDPFTINFRHFNRGIILKLKNRETLYGIFVEQVIVNGLVKGWKFVSNNDAIAYKKTKNSELEKIILYQDIDHIENAK
jgi:y4mF family transcriptional regulator